MAWLNLWGLSRKLSTICFQKKIHSVFQLVKLFQYIFGCNQVLNWELPVAPYWHSCVPMHVILFRMWFKKSFSKNLKFIYTKGSNDFYEILEVPGRCIGWGWYFWINRRDQLYAK